MFYSTNASGVRQGVNKVAHIDTRQAKSGIIKYLFHFRRYYFSTE